MWLFQEAPEAYQPSVSLDEALAFHGLTRAKMASEMIRWVHSVRLESPELHRAILYDPPHIKRGMEIRIWDFVFSTGMTTDYPVRRGWNDFMAIREFLQNALDIEERTFGYEGIEVGVWVDTLGLHISDRGPGITYEAFRLGGCYDTNTEILTRAGWKKYNQITFDDEIATLNTRGEIEYQKPQDIIIYHYKGKMLRIKSKNVDLLVTPDHWLYIGRINGEKPRSQQIRFKRVKAKDVINRKVWIFKRSAVWNCDDIDFFTIGDKKVPIEEWLQFFGFYLAEGHAWKSWPMVQLRSADKSLLLYFKALLEKWGFSPKIHQNGTLLLVYSRELYRYLKPLGKAWEKYIPHELKELPPDKLRILLEWYIKGDGHIENGRRWRAWTSSERLRDDLQEIALKLGWYATYYLDHKGRHSSVMRDGRVVNTKHKTWVVNFVQKDKSRFWVGDWETQRNYIKLEEYDGAVWCVTVPNHVIYVRRNGCPVWCGNSDKACYERGFYGEGLKVAMAHLVQRGCPVYVFNRRGQVFKAFVSPGTNLVLIAMGRFTKHVAGTEVIVYGLPEMSPEWSDPSYVRRIIFKEWLKDPNLEVITVKKWRTDACPYERPNFIVSARDGTSVDFLWVRDIVVNKISTITRLPSVFGYNLWWPTLEPNRVAVSSVPELCKEAAKAFDEASVRVLLDRVVEGVSVKKGLFETEQVDWWYASDEAKTEAAEWVKKKGFGVTDNEKALDWALYLGVTPLIVTWNMKPLFSKAPSLEIVIAEKSVERITTAEQNVVPLESLSLRERCNLRAAEIVMESVHVNLRSSKELAPKVFVTNKMPGAEGTVHRKKIYILREKLRDFGETIECVLHEYSHYYGREVYGAARDLSEAFERALGTVATVAALLPIEVKFALKRALGGAWGARNIVWTEGGYVERVPISITLQRAINDAVASVGIPPGNIFLSDYQRYIVDYNTPLIVWARLTLEQVNSLKGGKVLTDVYLDTSYGVYDILEYWKLPFADINLYKATLEKELTKILERIDQYKDYYKDYLHIILLYNPEEDAYEVWKVVPPRQT